ncbi:MAG: ParM/StbA family protein, partial [Microcystaceae cyanobacterium]
LSPAIAQYLEQNTDVPLHSLLRSNEPQQELNQLKRAIALSQRQYEVEIGNWLKEMLPRTVTEIILGGGTADTFKACLFEMLAGKSLYLHAQVELPEDVKAMNMGNRFGDVWVMWDYFIKKQALAQQTRKSA